MIYYSNTNNFMNTLKQVPLVILFGAGLLLSPVNAMAEVKLKFGAYAADKPTESLKNLRPVLNELEKLMSAKLGKEVKITTQIATNYDKAIDDLVAGRVDFAKFGPASYVIAKRQENSIQLLAMEAVNGKKVFKGIIAIKEDSDIQNLTELKGRSFAFGNELSTIGRYLSQHELLKVGVKGSDLSNFKYLGRHDRVGAAVGNGDFDAGALKASTFKKLQSKGVPIKKLAEFNNVTKPWIAKAGLSNELVEALKTAFLEMDNPDVMKIIKKTGFLESSDADYDSIRDAIKESQYF